MPLVTSFYQGEKWCACYTLDTFQGDITVQLALMEFRLMGKTPLGDKVYNAKVQGEEDPRKIGIVEVSPASRARKGHYILTVGGFGNDRGLIEENVTEISECLGSGEFRVNQDGPKIKKYHDMMRGRIAENLKAKIPVLEMMESTYQ